LQNGSGRKQRDLMLAAPPAEENAYADLLHDQLVWTEGEGRVNLAVVPDQLPSHRRFSTV
jgi:hypothetical protein